MSLRGLNVSYSMAPSARYCWIAKGILYKLRSTLFFISTSHFQRLSFDIYFELILLNFTEAILIGLSEGLGHQPQTTVHKKHDIL